MQMPTVELRAELVDPFGAVVGRGTIVMDAAEYAIEDEAELRAVAVGSKTGQYDHADGPNPNARSYIRLAEA